MTTATASTRFTLKELARLHERGEKIVMLTCYDASFAALAEAAGVEVLLVGDSLGMFIQGHPSTLPVTLEDVA
jgi:3-methyl-2-oxobutanoate hydroxymethyltransferase